MLHRSKLALAALWLCLSPPAAAGPGSERHPPPDCASFADQTLRWVVTTRPGGGYDAYSRLIQPHLERRLGARILIENRPEAGGIVGANAIREAPADGRTLGLINASGLLVAHLSGRELAPDPVNDLTVLVRLVSNRMMLLTGARSGIGDLAQLKEVAGDRALVVAVRDAGSASFFVLPILAQSLGLRFSLVTGYVGSTARVLALVRGEVDVILQTFDSVRSHVRSGELVPLLWVPDTPAGTPGGAVDDTVPNLTQAGRRVDAQAVESLLAGGRVVVAPRGLSETDAHCLERALLDVLSSDALIAHAEAAGLSLEPTDAAATRAQLLAVEGRLAPYLPLVRAAMNLEQR